MFRRLFGSLFHRRDLAANMAALAETQVALKELLLRGQLGPPTAVAQPEPPPQVIYVPVPAPVTDWADYPPGVASPRNTVMLEKHTGDNRCDICDTQEKRLIIDPIQQYRHSPTPEEPDRVFMRERHLCSKCYSMRYNERYPGVAAPGETPD